MIKNQYVMVIILNPLSYFLIISREKGHSISLQLVPVVSSNKVLT